MKIGIAAAKTPNWPKVDWAQQAAIRLGHEVMRSTRWNDLPPLFEECDFVIAGHKSLAGRWPNVSHVLESRQCPLLYWWFDLVATNPGVPIVKQPLYNQFKNFFHESDLVFVKEMGLVDEYRESGCKAYYLDQGCPSDYPSVQNHEKKWDLLVWGQTGKPYHERTRNARAVADAGYKVAWAGPQAVPGTEHIPWTPPWKLPELASQAKCVLSCGARNDIAYWSDQFWLACGMGACVLRRSCPGLPDGPFLVYHTNEELVDSIRWVTKNTKQARELGQSARTWVMENHTYEHRMQEAIMLAQIVMGRGRYK